MRQIPHHWPWNVVQNCTAFARKHVSNRQLVSGVQTRFNSKNERNNFQGYVLSMQNCFLPLSKKYFTLHLGICGFPTSLQLFSRARHWELKRHLPFPSFSLMYIFAVSVYLVNKWRRTNTSKSVSSIAPFVQTNFSSIFVNKHVKKISWELSRWAYLLSFHSAQRLPSYDRELCDLGSESTSTIDVAINMATKDEGKKCSKSNWMTRMTPLALSVNKQVYKAKKWKGIKFRNRWIAQRRSTQHESVLSKMNWEERQPSWPTYLKCKYNILSRYFELSCLKLYSTVKKSIVDAVGKWFDL